MTKIYKLTAFLCLISILITTNIFDTAAQQSFRLAKEDLKDKVMGGWAGQVIGCTYGGPTEFLWNGTMIDDRVPIPWDDQRMMWYYENFPGLYDDVYMDLTFVDVFEKHGLDAPDSLHALAFANAGYPLWHANQAARYNILSGIMPPASGHWKNNPHADDIDFQIESDFAGLMSPGMINTAVKIADKIGHIMNYGDGVYGGMYVAGMYALAFVHNDIEYIVEKALKTIPEQSMFYQCIADVIKWYKQNPNDWKATWFEAQKKWTHDIGCPNGVFNALNIDAKINAAYIVIGLLYGKGDYGATIDISTRCGYDSDCNPANAAGILGTMIGYSNIPDYWKQGLDKVEDLNFSHTDISLNRVYEIGTRHASEMIVRNGGKENENDFIIKYQNPTTVPLEIAFEGLHPVDKRTIGGYLSHTQTQISFEIDGSAFVLTGYAADNAEMGDAILEIDLYIDNVFTETIKLPTAATHQRTDLAWNYDLEEAKHTVTIKTRNIPEGYTVNAGNVVIYSINEPKVNTYF